MKHKAFSRVMTATSIVLQTATEINLGWTPNWADDLQDKFMMVIHNDVIKPFRTFTVQHSTVYFPTEELCQRCINEFTKDDEGTELLIAYLTQNF